MNVLPLDQGKADELRELIRASRGVGGVFASSSGEVRDDDASGEDEPWADDGDFEGDLLSWSEWAYLGRVGQLK